jgi:hypothetical protein
MYLLEDGVITMSMLVTLQQMVPMRDATCVCVRISINLSLVRLDARITMYYMHAISHIGVLIILQLSDVKSN